MSMAVPHYRRLSQPRNDLTCSVCKQIVTEFDNWITSETTEAEIVEFVEQVRPCWSLDLFTVGPAVFFQWRPYKKTVSC